MTTVQTSPNAVSQALLDSVNGTKTTSASSADATQDRFMKLLVAQMKNQDPLNPMDNAQVTSQMAQLSTVSGIDKLNTTVESMMSSMQSSQSLQVSNLIGHDVLVNGNQFSFDGTKGYFAVDVPSSTDNLNVTISDSAGNPVRTLTLGAQKEGIAPFSWDGYSDAGALSASGNYKISVSATSGGEAVTVNPLTLTQVSSVTSTTSGVKLNLSNSSTVTTSDLKQIY